MTQRELVCISCPMGCRMTVTLSGGEVSDIKGNTCPRGEAYAKDECVAPKRVVTALARVDGTNVPLPVKTASPIPKEKMFACMSEISKAIVYSPVGIGDVIVKDVCGTGVDVVATADVR